MRNPYKNKYNMKIKLQDPINTHMHLPAQRPKHDSILLFLHRSLSHILVNHPSTRCRRQGGEVRVGVKFSRPLYSVPIGFWITRRIKTSFNFPASNKLTPYTIIIFSINKRLVPAGGENSRLVPTFALGITGTEVYNSGSPEKSRCHQICTV